MQELRVENAIIAKQFENSDNYEEFIKISKSKNIKVKLVEAGTRINIEKNLYFDVLWPCSKNVISENILNNNSLVCNLHYKDFSILFTGDIEEIAEKAILQKYKNILNVLNSTIIKVAHHGSKTSSAHGFLNSVKPKIALIGVGKNNKFGHPSDITLENLSGISCEIYRTDEDGEIIIKVDYKGRIRLDK